MRKIKYLTPILGLTAAMGLAAPIATSCAKAVESKTLPINCLEMNGVTVTGIVGGTDLTKYDTIEIPEGTQFVGPSAFYDITGSKFDYSTIKTLKLPATLRGVKGDAFLGLNKLTVIDLTSWTPETIQYITFDSVAEPFGETTENDKRSCKVNLPAGLSIQEEKEAKKKLMAAGIPEWWFIDQTTGHISATEGVAKEVNALCTTETTIQDEQWSMSKSKISLTLANTFDEDKYELQIELQKTASTADIDEVAVDYETVDEKRVQHIEITDHKIVTFNVDMWGAKRTDTDPYPMRTIDGHAVNYDINVICYKKPAYTGDVKSVAWTQKVEGFKIVNEFQHVTSIKFDTEEKEKDVYLSAFPTVVTNTVLVDKSWVKTEPSTATYTDFTITSSDPKIIDAAKWTEAYNFVELIGLGSADILVQSDDVSTLSDSIKVNVVGITIDERKDALTGDVPYFGTYFGKLPGAEKYGYTLQPNAVVTFKSGKLTNTCTDMYNPISDAGVFRTFGVYQYVQSSSGYREELIPIKSVTITVTRTVAGETKQIPLYIDKDFMIENTFTGRGGIVMLDKDADHGKFQFLPNDEVEFTFALDNETELKNCGFEFIKYQNA